jgi:hypothetical protein
MKVIRSVALIGLGMVMAAALFYSVNAVRAQGPGGMMDGWGLMSGNMTAMHAQMGGDMAAMHEQMGGDMAAMHAQMHDGEAMPTECAAMMEDPAMREHMDAMMAGGAHMTPEEARAWMEDAGIPADVQAQCLDHMAEHHPAPEPVE